MTFLVERLAELRKHLDHLYEIRGEITGPEIMRRELTLHNDALFSLLTISQLVIDIAGELSARRGLQFEDYTEAIRNLAAFDEFSDEQVRKLEVLPGFRNIVVHEYIALDLQRVVDALNDLDPIEDFLNAAAPLADS